ncbi:hypothetical protein Tsubulata_016463 [Turnera subulata]|uniref:AAA+ ATPase domain-containing protein n=1 Tax=Turnera subulata TaxID=218843 RepID=A0A9Q0JJG7_9ROSI|nr:hypothetical protein Tsubulata_016463 [Turnera subulata]
MVSVANQLVPKKLQEKLLSYLGKFFGEKLSPQQLTLIINESNPNRHSTNEIYEAAEVYLSTRISPSVSQLNVFKDPEEAELRVSITRGEEVNDAFEGIDLVWEFIPTETQDGKEHGKENKSAMLSFQKQYKDKVLKTYLPHVVERSKAIKHANRVIKLRSLGDCGDEVNLNHPSTFDSLAMDPILKKELMDDLDRFLQRKDFYRRVGKLWKRGYLSYGPPGTGKSSLVAAMANYLKFDIYDLELANLRGGNSCLKEFLTRTSNRSIIVLEDIDCTIQLQDRRRRGYSQDPEDTEYSQDTEYGQGNVKLTLSGLLNFVDGLWSSCGDERIFVFTTNYKDRLDPALLRPGRMDMHIHMSYCTPAGFRILASNYLNTQDHSLFAEIEELIQQVHVTPAEIAGELIKTDDVDAALNGLIEFLLRKKETKCVKPSVEEEQKMPSTSSVLSTYTAFAASAMVVRTVISELQTMINQLMPKKLQEKLLSYFGKFFGEKLSPQQLTLIIKKSNPNRHATNEIYEAAEVYLSTIVSPSVSQLNVFKDPEETELTVSITRGEEVIDTFEGIDLVWEFIATEDEKEPKSAKLSFQKQYKDKVLKTYLPHVVERSKTIKNANRVIKLYSLGDCDDEVNLNHPSTFDTLAMDPVLKKELMDDLDRFLQRKDFYRRVGKLWKRGYLLYGPPGTGKSSLIAAMANYLKFDIYDLELASLRGSNSYLKELLTTTSNRSIIVIEDIDCTIQLQDRGSRESHDSEDTDSEDTEYGHSNTNGKLTLSGLLNFVDGLWSSCGDERIFVFTTNYKDRLDPALLRPGRMDMHIHMSYCTPAGFKILASNYLNIQDHSLFAEIEELIQQVEVTPAEIAGELIKTDDVDAALNGLIEFLSRKKETICEKPSVGEEKKS